MCTFSGIVVTVHWHGSKQHLPTTKHTTVIMVKLGRISVTKETPQYNNNNWSLCSSIYNVYRHIPGTRQMSEPISWPLHEIYTKQVQSVFTWERLRNTTKGMILSVHYVLHTRYLQWIQSWQVTYNSLVQKKWQSKAREAKQKQTGQEKQNN